MSGKFVLGLTGPSGAGKSILREYLRGEGAAVIDADAFYHEKLAAGAFSDALRDAFGEGIFTDGLPDRKKMRAVVFRDPRKLELLGVTVHPLLRREIKRLVESIDNELVVIDAPLLYEAGADTLCDRVFAVFADKDKLKERIMARDGLTGPEAAARLRAAKPQRYYIQRGAEILRNDGAPEDLISAYFKAIERG